MLASFTYNIVSTIKLQIAQSEHFTLKNNQCYVVFVLLDVSV